MGRAKIEKLPMTLLFFQSRGILSLNEWWDEGGSVGNMKIETIPVGRLVLKIRDS